MHVRCIRPLVTLALLVAAVAAHAQTPISGQTPGHWAPWVGCWAPIDAQASARDLRVCVVPTAAGLGARLVTFAGERQLNEETIVPDDTVRATHERGCRREVRTRWASAGERLFSNGLVTCDGQAAQPSSAISTLLSRDRWVDVQVTGPAGREAVRLTHYARSTAVPPAALADDLRAQPASPASLATRVNLEDIVEASQAVAAPAVEVWVAETEPRLQVNRRALQTLSAAKVPEPVIDLLVGLAFPKRFDVRRPSAGGFATGAFGFGGGLMADGPWDIGWDSYGMFTSMYAPFGLALVGSGFYPYGYPYYFDGFGYGGGFVNGPVGPMAPGEPVASGTGLVVNGRGYTRVQPREPVVQSGTGRRGGDGFTASMPAGGGDGSAVSPAGYSSGDSGGGSGNGGSGGGGGNFAVPR